MPESARLNASSASRRHDDPPEYEYYYEYDEINFDDLAANKYSIVIGFWCGLAILIGLLFLISSLLFRLGLRSGSRHNSWRRRSSSVKSLHMEVSTQSDPPDATTDNDNLLPYAASGGGGAGRPSHHRNSLTVPGRGAASPAPASPQEGRPGPTVRVDVGDERGDAATRGFAAQQLSSPSVQQQQQPCASASSPQQHHAFAPAPCRNGGAALLSHLMAGTGSRAGTPPARGSSTSISVSGDV